MWKSVYIPFFVLDICKVSSGLLTPVSSCICPGYEATFECTVSGGTTTSWQGTALRECPGESITIRHSQFSLELVRNDSCSNFGKVTVRSVSFGSNNGFYTSQLTLTISETLNGTTIERTNESDTNTVNTNFTQNQLLLLLSEGNLFNNNIFCYSSYVIQ